MNPIGAQIMSNAFTFLGDGMFVVNSVAFANEGGNAISFSANGNIVTIGNITLLWDVVGCQYILECPDGFIWSAIRGQCVCNIDVDCVEECKNTCQVTKGEEDCDHLVLDPATCECVHQCSDNGQCIEGTVFNVEKCKCVPTRCHLNPLCDIGYIFDQDECICVPGTFCSEPIVCRLGTTYSSITCKCEPVVCPAGSTFSFSAGACTPPPTGNCTAPGTRFNPADGLCEPLSFVAQPRRGVRCATGAYYDMFSDQCIPDSCGCTTCPGGTTLSSSGSCECVHVNA